MGQKAAFLTATFVWFRNIIRMKVMVSSGVEKIYRNKNLLKKKTQYSEIKIGPSTLEHSLKIEIEIATEFS